MPGQETYDDFLKRHGIAKESEEEIALLETVFGISFSPEAPSPCSEPTCNHSLEDDTEEAEEMTDDEILHAVKDYLQMHPDHPLATA